MATALDTDNRDQQPTAGEIADTVAFEPLTPPESIQLLKEASQSAAEEGPFSSMKIQFPSTQDEVRDEAYSRKYYGVAQPHEMVREATNSFAIPRFDRYDLERCLDLLGGSEKLHPVELEALKVLIYRRAWGEFKDKKTDWQTEASTQDPITTGLFRKYSASQIDAAICKATSVEQREGIRVWPYHASEKEPGYIDPQLVPSGPLIAIRGNPTLGQGTAEFVRRRVKELLAQQPGQKTGEGTFLLSDLHVFGKFGESEIFKQVVGQLAKSPPARLLIGGDVIDAVGFQRRFGQLSPDEQRIQRQKEICDCIKMLRDALPDTKILLQMGNHDSPRPEELSLQRGVKPLKLLGVELGPHEVPRIKLENGRLPENWLADFRTSLFKIVVDKRESSGQPDVSGTLQGLDDQQLLPIVRQLFQIKGVQKSAETLRKFRYYDESFGDELKEPLKQLDVEVIDTRCDGYKVENLGTERNPLVFLIIHEPQEMGPNVCRMMLKKDTVYNQQTNWGPGIRGNIAFDQHSAGSVLMTDDGADVSYHLVGSMTPNAKPGQRFMCAVVDPQNGNLYHLTFDDGAGKIAEPHLAEYSQIHYILPELDPERPHALTVTTKPSSY